VVGHGGHGQPAGVARPRGVDEYVLGAVPPGPPVLP
jgi:hypothetical protein